MRSKLFVVLLGIVFAGSALGVKPVVLDEMQVEPGLSYGKSDAFSLPKTLLFSAGADAIAADAAAWKEQGIDGFFLDSAASEWSSDIWATDGKPWTVGASDDTFQKVKAATAVCRPLGQEVFLKIAFSNYFEWFNDTQWQQAVHNFRQFAIFARDTGCTGLAIDIEYVGPQYNFEWDKYDYKGYTREDLWKKVHERGASLAKAMYDEFPEMVLLTLPEEGLCMGTQIHTAWIEEAARRNAPGGVHYCSEGTYRAPNVRHLFGTIWGDQELFRRVLAPEARAYWQEKCTIAAGVWPFGTGPDALYAPGMPLEAFRQEWAASLTISPRYQWIFADRAVETMLGRKPAAGAAVPDLSAYLKIIRDKEVITTPRYVALAQALREGRDANYSKDLNLVPAPSFYAPQGSPFIWLAPAQYFAGAPAAGLWDLGVAYYHGEALHLAERLDIPTHWRLIGPFANDAQFSGHSAVYPPEQSLAQDAEYDGLDGKVRWTDYESNSPMGSVEFAKVFKPTEHTCAYALCYVTSDTTLHAQLRIGTNDYGKAWLDGKLIYDYPHEGMAYLDRDIVPVTLPKGRTPLLIKVCNGIFSWDFVARLTDPQGQPLKGIHFDADAK